MSIRIYKKINCYFMQMIDISEQDFLLLLGMYETIEFRYKKFNKNQDNLRRRAKIVHFNIDNAKGVIDRFKVKI